MVVPGPVMAVVLDYPIGMARNRKMKINFMNLSIRYTFDRGGLPRRNPLDCCWLFCRWGGDESVGGIVNF